MVLSILHKKMAERLGTMNTWWGNSTNTVVRIIHNTRADEKKSIGELVLVNILQYVYLFINSHWIALEKWRRNKWKAREKQKTSSHQSSHALGFCSATYKIFMRMNEHFFFLNHNRILNISRNLFPLNSWVFVHLMILNVCDDFYG